MPDTVVDYLNQTAKEYGRPVIKDVMFSRGMKKATLPDDDDTEDDDSPGPATHVPTNDLQPVKDVKIRDHEADQVEPDGNDPPVNVNQDHLPPAEDEGVMPTDKVESRNDYDGSPTSLTS